MNSAPSRRIVSIDILRGIIMVIMALDHTRDFFSNYHYDPLDLEHTTTAMFLTRWITHFCAPVFVFFAGTSSFLSFNRGKTKKEAAWFLLSRGIWLIILEFTIIRIGWMFNVDYTHLIVQVIWAIGWSMIVLSGLIFLPYQLILCFGLVVVFGHNALDNIHAENIGQNAGWWNVLHEMGLIHLTDNVSLFVIYPLIPWIGVMALGYCFGKVFTKPEQDRNMWLYSIGIAAVVLFIITRYINVYGDMHHWVKQDTILKTILSFIDCTKYPPSLLYLLMTLGPAILLLPMLEKWTNKISGFFLVFGRVPMFYYILHIYLIHIVAIIVAMTQSLPVSYFTEDMFAPKPGWGFGLTGVYLFWFLIVGILYFPCRWFMKIKLSHKKWWLSYL
ncbi:MAG: DUF1624 domain-containing protein [Bacteroidetes bacterium]|nr:DUF1624 domain-containing protein [Bacteroidota bacterium]